VSAYDLVNGFDAMRAALASPGGGPAAIAKPSVMPIKYGGNLPGPPAGSLAGQFAAMRSNGTYDDWVNTIASLKGLTPEERDAFYQLGMGESGGRNIGQEIDDINMQNGTPAFGPWQVIKPTFEAYKEPGYDDWQDPVANGLASINYQRARYGRILSQPGY
jgi:hypothetical protein